MTFSFSSAPHSFPLVTKRFHTVGETICKVNAAFMFGGLNTS